MYHFFIPSAALQPYIEVYWLLHSDTYVVDKTVFVDGCADLIFNFGASYQRGVLNNSNHSQSQTCSTLDAHREHPLLIHQTGTIHLLGVRFRPGGLAAFLTIPAHELANHTLDLTASFGPAAADLEGQLFDSAGNARHQIGLLDAFFLRRLAPLDSHVVTRVMASQIEQRGGGILMRALSDDTGYSIRTVDRLFRQNFGMGPKFYARIVRFQRAMGFLSRNGPTTFTDTAFEYGYYDLAHFSKECIALSGLSAESCRQFMLARLEEPPPHLVQFLQA